jgi:hypothetical protein
MKKNFVFALLFLAFLQSTNSQEKVSSGAIDPATSRICIDSRPWTRWWWFASMIDKGSVNDNLSWLKNNGFGGR